jgi:hypothetical protein
MPELSNELSAHLRLFCERWEPDLLERDMAAFVASLNQLLKIAKKEGGDELRQKLETAWRFRAQ